MSFHNFHRIKILSIYEKKIVYLDEENWRKCESELDILYSGRRIYRGDKLLISKSHSVNKIIEYFNLSEIQRGKPKNIQKEVDSIRDLNFRAWININLKKENLTEEHKKMLQQSTLTRPTHLDYF